MNVIDALAQTPGRVQDLIAGRGEEELSANAKR
jgi:hypothetical protein